MTPAKRALDLLVAGLGLLLTGPILLIVGLLIKLEDGGPMFFRQERVGYRGRIFRICKFRTMREQQDPGLPLTVGADERITAIGRHIRALKLDELPQLINVLLGHMTLVGPRPEVPRYVASYTPEQRGVLELVPGITDSASLYNWDETAILANAADPERAYLTQILPDKVRRQLEYGRYTSLRRDLAILGETGRAFILRLRTATLNVMVRVRLPLVLLVHLLIVIAGYRLAYDLRFDFALPPEAEAQYWYTLTPLVLIRLLVYLRFGLHRGYWRHVSTEDLTTIFQAVTVSSGAFLAACFALGEFPGVPRSVLVIDWVAAIFLTGGARFLARAVLEAQAPSSGRPNRRTLVVGAGNRAEHLLRETRRDSAMGLKVVGILTDDPDEQDRSIHNVRVRGTIDQLERIAQREAVGLVIIALDTPTTEQTQRIVSHCTRAGIEFKTVPSFKQLLDGSARADQLHNLRLEDLLGRAPVRFEPGEMENRWRDKVMLVTGGAGSIGSELARQIARYRPARLVLLDHAESALYFTTLDIEAVAPGVQVVPVVCDIANEHAVSQAFADHQPQLVLHAAAYKQVPMMEINVIEAVRNNVLGTLLVADAAATWGAEQFVLISTDKAVNPSSVMGATKRVAERAILGLPSLRRASTGFRAVRFGNVLGSAGSVVPLFERQLVNGGPLTVTHPDVERYFMTIGEAAQLVLQAAVLPEATGRITMLEMGHPVRVLDLAEKMIRLAGQEPYRDVQIVFTGLRPGEKLREELMSEAEATVPTAVERIRIVALTEESGPLVRAGVDGLLQAMRHGAADLLLKQLRRLVPECEPPLRLESESFPDRPRPSPVPHTQVIRPTPVPGALAVPALPFLYSDGN